MTYPLFVSCAKGLEYLLEEELNALKFRVSKVSPQGVYGEADLSTLYSICLWSRLASRVQLILLSEQAFDQPALYKLCHEFPWDSVFTPDKTLHIEFHGSSPEIRNSMFGAQVVKDGIVDYFREHHNERPSIDRDFPQIRLHAHLKKDQFTLSFDLTGYSMHQRGYRLEAGLAPLKENIAAAMLVRAKWPALMASGHALHDPCCGSGTLVIEAAMMAAHIAPGLLRNDQSLHHWQPHQPTLWETLRVDALAAVKSPVLSLHGTDNNPQMIAIAHANAKRAGIEHLVTFTALPLAECQAAQPQGLLITNPPYGERLGTTAELEPLYKQLGQVLYQNFPSWSAAILTSNPLLAKAIGLRVNKQYTLFNGPLECKLYCLELEETNRYRDPAERPLSAGAEMFKNRLKKNFAHLQKWAKRNQISCYRVYDADLPEYAFAIDIYNDHAVLQEYVAPHSIDPQLAAKRSQELINVVPVTLGMPAEHVIVKQRRQQKGSHQYQKMNQQGRSIHVNEGMARFGVNLYDYLDTGLFLDHRPLRLRFARLPKGTRFLNLFCYTATASVHAALAGAITTNVDLSNTYLTWAEDNFKLNQLNVAKHQFIQEDCLEWLKVTDDRFDVIFLDPPSFSNSKRMENTLDIQRDHESLINTAMRLLSKDGLLYFSTNFRQFKLSAAIGQSYTVKDISAETIDLDFQRNKRIHRCYLITEQRP